MSILFIVNLAKRLWQMEYYYVCMHMYVCVEFFLFISSTNAFDKCDKMHAMFVWRGCVGVCVCMFGGVFEIVTIMWLLKVNIVYSEKAIVYIWFQTYFKSPNDPHLTWAMPILATILSHQIAKYLAKIARTVDNNNNSNSYIGPHRWCTLASVAYILRLVAVENISWFNRYIVGYR